MGESMKIELLEGGLDEAIRDIQIHLDQAVLTKNRRKKDLNIAYAQGVVNAIYRMTNVVDEAKVETQE